MAGQVLCLTAWDTSRGPGPLVWSIGSLRASGAYPPLLQGNHAPLPGEAGTHGDGDGVSQVADGLLQRGRRSEQLEAGYESPGLRAAVAVPGLVRLMARSLDVNHGTSIRRWSLSGMTFE